jgi:hypothetical protein
MTEIRRTANALVGLCRRTETMPRFTSPPSATTISAAKS